MHSHPRPPRAFFASLAISAQHNTRNAQRTRPFPGMIEATPFHLLTMRPSTPLLPFLLVLSALGGGCRDSAIVSYQIPKESDVTATKSSPPPPGNDMAGTAVATSSGADLVWTAPAHWQPKPGGGMRKGSYSVGPAGAAAADLAITAFPGDVGGELANVNRWRGQIGLAPIAAAELPAVITHFDANGLHISHLDIANQQQRMLAAFIPHGDSTWFVKLVGPDALVATEKPAFLAFLQTLRAAP